MNYQSAFTSGISPKAKPGLMCHAAAVTRYAAEGHAIYSLLAGEDRYKQSLSTGHETLPWWELERFSPGLEAEYMLRKIFRRSEEHTSELQSLMLYSYGVFCLKIT